jgi:hypothetical protein
VQCAQVKENNKLDHHCYIIALDEIRKYVTCNGNLAFNINPVAYQLRKDTPHYTEFMRFTNVDVANLFNSPESHGRE